MADCQVSCPSFIVGTHANQHDSDHSPILKVQIDIGTFTNVHKLVLCQNSDFFLDVCDAAHLHSNTLTWRSTSECNGRLTRLGSQFFVKYSSLFFR